MKSFLAVLFLLLLAPLVSASNQRSLRHYYDPKPDDVTSPPALPITESPTTSPSVAPSAAPSGEPSTASPSSLSPSFSPSVSPSVHPSLQPTAFFSMLPSHTPTTLAPTVFPSMIPSTLPSAAPTTSDSPSSIPSFFPTASMEPTTWSECRPNADGFFGSTNGSVYVVAYAYELETSFGNAQDDIIPALEKAISAAILPELFVNQCTDPSLNSTGKNSSVVGVSTRPDDVILDDVQCQAQLNDTYNCYVVMGGLTLFVDGSLQDEAGLVIDTLQQDMENDSFVDSSIGIERVTLVDLEPDPNPGTGTGGDEGSQNKGRNNGLIYGIVAGVAALLLALAAFAWRRRKQDEETAESLA